MCFQNRKGGSSLSLAPVHQVTGGACSPLSFLAHPNERCPRFRVFGLYDGPDDRFTFAVQEFDDRDKAERVARKLMEDHRADHFRRVMRG